MVKPNKLVKQVKPTKKLTKTMKNKLVKDIDEKVWRRFVAYCVLNDVKVGDELSKILEKELKNKIK